MKKIIALVAFVGAMGALAGLPSADVSRQAAAERVSILALMQVPASQGVRRYIPELGRYGAVESMKVVSVPQSLPVEAYDAI